VKPREDNPNQPVERVRPTVGKPTGFSMARRYAFERAQIQAIHGDLKRSGIMG
jgi:hypothetical protein